MKTRMIILLFAGLALLLGGWIGSSNLPQRQDDEQAEQIKVRFAKGIHAGQVVKQSKNCRGPFT